MTIPLPDVIGTLRRLGPPPVGSPAAIRDYAHDLRRWADRIDTTGRLLAGDATIDNFTGGAADRHRDAVTANTSRVRHTAEDLRRTAARLEAGAAQLEAGQRAWRRAQTTATQHLPHNLVASAMRQLGWKLP